MRASFDRLSSSARRLLSEASVFAGDWSLAAAEAICRDDSADPNDLLNNHVELRDHSLISVRAAGAATRYSMLNTIRRHAREQLDDAGDVTHRRHIRYYDDLARTASRALVSPHQLDYLQLVTDELDNVRAANDKAFEMARCGADPDMSATAILTTARLERFWYTTGRAVEGGARLRSALDLPEAPAQARREGLGALALLEASLERFHAAERAAAEMQLLADRTGDLEARCQALRNRGTIAVLQGDLKRGEDLLFECLRESPQLPDPDHTTAWVTALLGSAAYLRSDWAKASEHYTHAQRLFQKVGDQNFLALVQRRQAQLMLRATTRPKTPVRVSELAMESLRLNLGLRSPAGISGVLVVLAEASRQQGEEEKAASLLGRAAALVDVSRSRLSAPDVRERNTCQAAVTARLGEPRTREHHHAGRSIAWELSA